MYTHTHTHTPTHNTHTQHTHTHTHTPTHTRVIHNLGKPRTPALAALCARFLPVVRILLQQKKPLCVSVDLRNVRTYETQGFKRKV
jgi:hypothetical protein